MRSVLYCSILDRCDPVDCSTADEILSATKCACLTPAGLDRINGLIDRNAAGLVELEDSILKTLATLHDEDARRFAALSARIGDLSLETSDLKYEDGSLWIDLRGLQDHVARLRSLTSGYMQNWIENNAKFIAEALRKSRTNLSKLTSLKYKADQLTSDLYGLHKQVASHNEWLSAMQAAIYGFGIKVPGHNDERIPTITPGPGSPGGDDDCVKKNTDNYINADMHMAGDVEIINHDLEIRYDFPKGYRPAIKKQIGITIRDNEGNVTSDNLHQFSGTVDTDGTVQTFMRGYRFQANSTAHCDLALKVPASLDEEAYVWGPNFRIGCRTDAFAGNDPTCGSGWLETCDWIHGHTTLEIDGRADIHGDFHADQNVYLNEEGGETHIYGPTTIHNTLDVHKNAHFYQDVDIDWNLNVDKELTVHQNAYFKQEIFVDEDAHFHKNVYIDNDTYVYGIVESNISGNKSDALLLKVRGYDCSRSGQYQFLMQVFNGQKLAIGILEKFRTDICYTTAVLGGMRIHELSGMKGYLRVDGVVDVKDFLSVGYGNSGWDGEKPAFYCRGSAVIEGKAGDTKGPSAGRWDGGLEVGGNAIIAGGLSVNQGNFCINKPSYAQGAGAANQLFINMNSIEITALSNSSFVSKSKIQVQGIESGNSIETWGGIKCRGDMWCRNLDVNPGSIRANQIDVTRVNCGTINGESPVFCACGEGYHDSREVVIDYPAEKERIAKTEETPYNIKCMYQNCGMVWACGEYTSIGPSANSVKQVPMESLPDMYEAVVHLPIEFEPGEWTVTASYLASDATVTIKDPSITVYKEPSWTNKFIIFGSGVKYSWIVMGHGKIIKEHQHVSDSSQQ